MNDELDFIVVCAALVIAHGGLNKLDFLFNELSRNAPDRPQLICVQPNINDADINRNGRLVTMLAKPVWNCLPFEIVQQQTTIQDYLDDFPDHDSLGLVMAVDVSYYLRDVELPPCRLFLFHSSYEPVSFHRTIHDMTEFSGSTIQAIAGGQKLVYNHDNIMIVGSQANRSYCDGYKHYGMYDTHGARVTFQQLHGLDYYRATRSLHHYWANRYVT